MTTYFEFALQSILVANNKKMFLFCHTYKPTIMFILSICADYIHAGMPIIWKQTDSWRVVLRIPSGQYRFVQTASPSRLLNLSFNVGAINASTFHFSIRKKLPLEGFMLGCKKLASTKHEVPLGEASLIRWLINLVEVVSGMLLARNFFSDWKNGQHLNYRICLCIHIDACHPNESPFVSVGSLDCCKWSTCDKKALEELPQVKRCPRSVTGCLAGSRDI